MREGVCILPGHGVPSWGCWGCVGGAVRGGTAESRVVPLKKKSDIREWRAQKVGVGWGGGVYTWRDYRDQKGEGGKKRGFLAGGRKTEGVHEERRGSLEVVKNLHLDQNTEILKPDRFYSGKRSVVRRV